MLLSAPHHGAIPRGEGVTTGAGCAPPAQGELAHVHKGALAARLLTLVLVGERGVPPDEPKLDVEALVPLNVVQQRPPEAAPHVEAVRHRLEQLRRTARTPTQAPSRMGEEASPGPAAFVANGLVGAAPHHVCGGLDVPAPVAVLLVRQPKLGDVHGHLEHRRVGDAVVQALPNTQTTGAHAMRACGVSREDKAVCGGQPCTPPLAASTRLSDWAPREGASTRPAWMDVAAHLRVEAEVRVADGLVGSAGAHAEVPVHRRPARARRRARTQPRAGDQRLRPHASRCFASAGRA